MLILGIHGGFKRESDYDPTGHTLHDAAAVLIRDGKILAAIEEERLSRIKHSNCFPFRAIQRCLDIAGVGLEDVDAIATNMSQHVADAIERISYLEDSEYKLQPEGATQLASMFEEAFGVDVRRKIRFCNHHLAHALSAFVPCPYEQSLILTIDGNGDYCSGMVLVGEGSQITRLREYPIKNSLGHLYLRLIKFIGYRRFDEYKVMGLAPYGNPNTYANLFAKCYSLLPEGKYMLEEPTAWMANFEAAGLLKYARRKGQPFSRIHMDFAASLQDTLERIVLHILRYYQQQTSQKYLCLAGGVAHNCTLNGKIINSGLFDDVFIQPAAHDAGGALGAAWMVYFKENPNPRRPKLEHLYFGTNINEKENIGRRLDCWSNFLSFELAENVTAKTARMLAEGAVVGWVQGRSEFGPRALGNRSILADPRPAENKTLINEMVKKRESYRPFAPSVLEERVSDYFDVASHRTSFPYMIAIANVREEMRQLLGAVTHVDGTARLQTVSKIQNPLFWSLIYEFDKITGVPILLNTSFNNNAEPIVDSLDDAITAFLTTGINYLVVGKYVVNKKLGGEFDNACLLLAPEIPISRKLVKRRSGSGLNVHIEEVFEIESTKSSDFGTRTVPISAVMFSVLQLADGKKDFHCLLREVGLSSQSAINQLIDEIKRLWSLRVISVQPPQKL